MDKKIKKLIKKNKYRSNFYTSHRKPKENIKTSQEKTPNKFIIKFTNKVLASVVVLLCLLISRNETKLSFIYDYTFKNMNFMSIKTFITDKTQGLFPKTDDKHKYVDAIVIDINATQDYYNGKIIETNYSEPVLSSTDGIVISIYNDKILGDVVVIQDELGREYHYGYLDNIEVKIYSFVNYGDIIGIGRVNEAMNGEYYLAIKNGKEYLDVIDVVNQ